MRHPQRHARGWGGGVVRLSRVPFYLFFLLICARPCGAAMANGRPDRVGGGGRPQHQCGIGRGRGGRPTWGECGSQTGGKKILAGGSRIRGVAPSLLFCTATTLHSPMCTHSWWVQGDNSLSLSKMYHFSRSKKQQRSLLFQFYVLLRKETRSQPMAHAYIMMQPMRHCRNARLTVSHQSFTKLRHRW